MADTDIFGILSLLLFLGGAAYLLRVRALNRNARLEAASSEAADRSEAPDSTRSRVTVPPKILRSSSDSSLKQSSPAKGPAQDVGSTRGAATLSSSESFAGAAADSEPVPNTKPSAKNIAPAPESSGSSLAPDAPSTPPVSASGRPAAKTLMFGVALSSTLATSPKSRDAKVAAAKAATKKAGSDPIAPPQGASTKPSISPKSVPAKATPAKATPAKPEVSKATPEAVAKAKAPPSSTKAAKAKDVATKSAAPSRADLDALPRIDVEEDEDVEPTKVGPMSTRREIQPSVERIVFDEGANSAPVGKGLALGISSVAQTDPGKRRKQNEDSYLVLDDLGVYVVADGMGGHRGGQHASKLAVSTMKEAFEAGHFEAAPHPNLALRASELARAIQMANTAIFEEASRTPELKGMGTTLCAACFDADNRRMYIGHVGDSRCYRVRAGVMRQMTTDHTMADYGVTGPEGSHLSRALGVWPTVPIDILMAEPEVGDLYMVCSDGLTKMLPNETIATQLLHEDNTQAAIERLVFFANAHGGKDNITVILLRITAGA